MNKFEGRLSILGDDRGVKIELLDFLSNTVVASFKLTPEGFCAAALGRLSRLSCEFETGDLSRVGRKMEVDKMEFSIPDKTTSDDTVLLGALAKATCPEGWTPNGYFNSQDSFFSKNGVRYARCIIRRWVEQESILPAEMDLLSR